MTPLRCGMTCLVLYAGSLFGAPFEDPQSSSGTSGTVRGSVVDPTGAAIPAASVTIQNPVSHYTRAVKTDAQGKFEFDNIPFNNYHLTVVSGGFQPAERDIDVRSPIAIELNFSLTLGTDKTSIEVKAKGGDLVETDPVAHTDVDRRLFERLPLESQSSSLSSLVTLGSPGVAADSNGLFHGMGDHAQNSFSVDGQPITDQQSKVFSNQLPLDSVQSMEVIEGAPPAEYGGKTSLVIIVTTRSGMGVINRTASVNASYGVLRHFQWRLRSQLTAARPLGKFHLRQRPGHRPLSRRPEFGVMHDRGNQTNLFDRIDLQLSQHDTLNINLEFTRSWFQTPNSYDAQTAAAWSGGVVDNGGLGPNGQVVGSQDQRSQIRTFNVAPNWTRAIGGDKIFTFGGFLRQDQFNYYPSDNPFADLAPDLQNLTVGQNRRLTNIGAPFDFLLRQGHPQPEGRRLLSAHLPDRKGQLRNCRSYIQSARPRFQPPARLLRPH